MSECETIIIATIVASSTILTAWMTNWYNQKRWKTQNKAQFLSNFLKYRYEAIRDLFGNMVDCRTTINNFANEGVKTQEEYQEIQEKLDAFIDSKRKAEIWLDKDTYDLLNEVMGTFREFSYELSKSEPELHIEKWKRFHKKSYDEICERLRNISGIEIFEKYLKELKE